MDATVADWLVGQLLDHRYRVESRIARGGMATVYIATDTRLDRTVALKVMHRELAADDEFVHRFIGEAKSVARLSHPNVVAVFDQGSDGEHLYLAMEYVAGRTVRDLLNERGRLSPDEALDLMVPVLAGLGAAHQAGLVHRDVKPENVLITADKRIKVVDFGLARAAAQARHTKTGMLIGTVAYLAPEQISRAAADARSDVYAAGVMLFELLTGRQPYTGDTPLAVAYQHVNETVPVPSQVVPGLPHAVDALVALATSRDPELRPGDAGQLLRAIFDARRRLPGGSAFAPGPAMPFAGYQAPPGQPGPQALSPRQGLPGQQSDLGRQSQPGLQSQPGHLSQPGHQGRPGKHGRHAQPRAGGMPYGVAPPASMPGSALPAASFPATGQAPTGQAADGQQVRPAAARPQPSMIFGVQGVPGVPSVPAPPTTGAGVSTVGTSGSGGAAPRTGGPHAEFSGRADGQNNTLVVVRGETVYADQPPHRRGLGDWLFSRRAAYLAGGLAIALIAGLLVWWQAAGRYTRVPDVAGLTTSTAAAELRNVGFTVKVGAAQLNNHVPKGDVARTVPAIGARAPNGATITLIPSAGPRMIVVPNVTGMPTPDARKALIAAGLLPGPVSQQTSPTVPVGEVISTDPASGAVWPQTKPVKLAVSAGIGLPDFAGQPKQAAEQWLAQNHLKVQEQAVASNTQPQDSVVRQSPAANTPITQGEVVTLDISTGPPMVQIPSVTGMPAHDARKQLEELGFQVRLVGFSQGTVIGYSPTGQAPKGSTITLIAGPGGLP